MKRNILPWLLTALLALAPLEQTHAALSDIVTKGSTSRSVTVDIIDSTDGTPETGVVFNTSGIDLWYRREGGALVAITEATLAALTTAYSSGGFLHIANGTYRLDLPDAAFATGANYVDFGGTVTGMVVIGGRVRLVDYSLEDAVRGTTGTALPNAVAGATGGVLISGTNAGTTTLGALTVTGATTLTGNVSAAAGVNITQSTANTAALVVTGNGTGNGATITSGSGATGNGLAITAASTNGTGLALTGTGTGNGETATGGATGNGISGVGGSTSGAGFRAVGTAGNSPAMTLVGQGSAAGLLSTGGATGIGISAVGGATSGPGISATSTSGNGITASGGTAGHGIAATGGATGHGLNAVGGATSGNGLRAAGTAGNSAAMLLAGQGSADGLSSTGGATGNGVTWAGGSTSGNAINTTAVSPVGAVKELGIIDSGTAQAATGTTLQLRAAATFADSELVGAYCIITGGSAGVGQARFITANVGSTDTATVATWTTTPTGTITYECYGYPPGAGGSVSIAAGGISASSFAAGAIDASAIATDAIGAAELAANAIGSAELATGAITTATFAAGAIDATAIATDAIGAAEVAASAIGSSEIAADALTAAKFDSTAGSFPALGIIDQGTAQAATGTTLQLRSAASFDANDEIVGATCVITGGTTGVGQSRTVTAYTNATDTATVATWTTTPTGTILYKCYGTASTSGGGSGLDAAATRAALGLASANLDTQLGAIAGYIDTEVAAIKTKTDFLPSATAGAAGGLFIAGTNAATSITTALTANITGNLSGSVGSVSGAVGSVTGAVGSVTTVSDKTGYRLSATGVDDVWDEAKAGHATANTYGAYLDAAISGVSTGGVSADTIAQAVWDMDATAHQTQGSFGQITGDSGATATSIWSLANTNLNATVSSRASATSLGTPVGASISADIAAVQADTDNLQTRVPTALVSGRIDASVGAYQTGLTPLQPTTSGRTLDVSATGEAGVDWANVGSPTTTVALSGTTVGTATALGTDALNSTSLASSAVSEMWAIAATEPTGKPVWGSSSLKQIMEWMSAFSINKVTQTSTTKTLRNTGDSGNLVTCAVSDNGTTFTLSACSP